MARFTSILDRLGGGNSNVVSRLAGGRKLPMGSGLFNPVEVVETGDPKILRISPPVKHKKHSSKKHHRKEGVSRSKSEEYNPRYTSWFKKAKKINLEGEGIHFNKKKE